jgi:hypothetical protein
MASCQACYRSEHPHFTRKGQVICGMCNDPMHRPEEKGLTPEQKICALVSLPYSTHDNEVVVSARSILEKSREMEAQWFLDKSLKGRNKMVKTNKAVLTVLLALILGAGAAVAQHDHAAITDPSQSKPDSTDMMNACHKHSSEAMAALDKLEKTIAEGRESNDPAKMKAALDTAQKQLAEAKHHMNMCPMMSSGHMQDGGMDHMNGMSGESDKH